MSISARNPIRWIETSSPKVRAKVDLDKLTVIKDRFVSSNIEAEPDSEARRRIAEILADMILEWDAREGDREILPTTEFLTTVSRRFLKDLYEQIRQAGQVPPEDKEAYTKWLVSDGAQGRVPDWVTLIEVAKALGIPPWEAEELAVERANQAIDYLNHQLATAGHKRRFPHF